MESSSGYFKVLILGWVNQGCGFLILSSHNNENAVIRCG